MSRLDSKNTNENSEGLFDFLDNHNLDHVKVEIFLCLDYKSLHIARQVSRGWKDFIDKEIWSVRKSHAKKLIAREWRNNEPVQQIIQCPSNNIQDIIVDDEILLAESFRKIIFFEPLSGKSIDPLDPIHGFYNNRIPDLWDMFMRNISEIYKVHGTRDISSRIVAFGMGYGSIPGQVVILDRSSLKLICSVHLPGNEEYLTNDKYKFVQYVMCVKIVGDYIVAGGFDGTLTAFSFRSILDQAAPNEDIIKVTYGVPLVIGFWHFKDLNPIEDILTTKMDDRICFLEKDGTWLLVISNKNGALWDFSRGPHQRTTIEGILGMVHRVTDCALKYPYAFFATRYEGELRGHKLLEILDIEMNHLMRKIEIRGPSMYNLCITLNESILVSKIQFEELTYKEAKARIFLHDVQELVSPYLSNSELWMKILEYPGFDEGRYPQNTNFHLAHNLSTLFAISGSNVGYHRPDNKIYIWNFLNNKNSLDDGPVKGPEKESLLKWFKSNTRTML